LGSQVLKYGFRTMRGRTGGVRTEVACARQTKPSIALSEGDIMVKTAREDAVQGGTSEFEECFKCMYKYIAGL
jgi:hypothetical protein